MDLEAYDRLFKNIIRHKHGKDVDFKQIESKLDHLRSGEALKYNDLLIIGDDRFWPFSEYWMWPAEYQIADKLSKTAGWLSQLPDREDNIIGDLCAIFKNISLVSIILRLETEYKILDKLRKLRNKAIHPSLDFSREDARFFIDETVKLAARSTSW